jgi:hypothetical protein
MSTIYYIALNHLLDVQNTYIYNSNQHLLSDINTYIYNSNPILIQDLNKKKENNILNIHRFFDGKLNFKSKDFLFFCNYININKSNNYRYKKYEIRYKNKNISLILKIKKETDEYFINKKFDKLLYLLIEIKEIENDQNIINICNTIILNDYYINKKYHERIIIRI